jgi:hypothetical protein
VEVPLELAVTTVFSTVLVLTVRVTTVLPGCTLQRGLSNPTPPLATMSSAALASATPVLLQLHLQLPLQCSPNTALVSLV